MSGHLLFFFGAILLRKTEMKGELYDLARHNTRLYNFLFITATISNNSRSTCLVLEYESQFGGKILSTNVITFYFVHL